ncbi:MAG: hypothetical protein WCD43_02500 [Candidatus Acidiferrales bacterium]
MAGVLTIKRLGHGKKIFAAFFAIGGTIIALMPAHLAAQASGKLTPPAPSQSTVQVPTQPASATQTPEAPSQVVQRTVSVTFDYDFSAFPPCSAKVTKKCIQQFNVWEVSAPTPIFLFSIPISPDAKGLVKGITGTAPKKRALFTGPHRFGVSAKMAPPGGESNPYQCMVFAQVLPDNPAAPTQAPGSSSPQK